MRQGLGFAAALAVVLWGAGCASEGANEPLAEQGHAPAESQTILDDSLERAREASDR